MMTNKISILGVRGVPAAHGGFETFAERLAIYLYDRGWDVLVYCQKEGTGAPTEDTWQGIRRMHVPVRGSGPVSTVTFDWKSTAMAARDRSRLVLTLGYNTAVFCTRLRLAAIPIVINMDGIEWARGKWSLFAKTWFYLNDWAGCLIGNHLVADHPEIMAHLASRVSTRKITVIPYGADRIDAALDAPVRARGLKPNCFVTLIARPEPENSVLEVVKAFSRRRRGVQLAVLGNYDVSRNSYHRKILRSASEEVKFLGAIYDREDVAALRFHSLLYVHGHQVGGTNPSLVEALGAGNPILAHDNRFNRWVAGPCARYFSDESSCDRAFEELLDCRAPLSCMSTASRQRHQECFTWESVLQQYEALLLSHHSTSALDSAGISHTFNSPSSRD